METSYGGGRLDRSPTLSIFLPPHAVGAGAHVSSDFVALPNRAGPTRSVPRMTLPDLTDRDTLRSCRQRGVSLCSRARSEREMCEARQRAADEAVDEVEIAREAVEDTRFQLAEGVIQADGSAAPPKRKRQSGSRAPGSRRVSHADKMSAASGDKGASNQAGAKRPRTSEDGQGGAPGIAGDGSGGNVKEVSAGGSKTSSTKKSGIGSNDKGGKASKKGGGTAVPPLFEAGALVEVGLRLGDAFANWYHARLLELIKARWRVALQRRGEDGNWEPLLLEGRTATEMAKLDMIRPLPPALHEWTPVVGEHCELLFEDGWWKVRVQDDAGGDFTVVYAPANAVHTVGRERLRPIFTWDMKTQEYTPIKIGGRR